MAQGIWVISSLENNQLSSISKELFTPAKQLSESLSQPITAVILTSNESAAQAVRTELDQLGAQQVLVIHHALLETFQSQLFTQALVEVINSKQPSVILFGADTIGTDVAPRISIKLNAGLITGATELKINENGALEASKARFAESLLSTVACQPNQIQMAIVKRKAYPVPSPLSSSATVEVIQSNLSAESAKSKLLSLKAVEGNGKKKLEDADIIVSGGRGLKEASNFKVVEDLADALGAAVGASRAVVDAGWRPHSEQVGQTGKTVSPKLYVALGISGAIQHLVGMNSSQKIIAINRDENAPIFKVADIAVVGDALEIAPLLAEAIKKSK